jgi:hypothetical protein
MSRLPLHDGTLAPALLSGSPYTRYLVVCHQDVWFIKFDGEEYGPYQTKREAMLFAIDAAQKLGGAGGADTGLSSGRERRGPGRVDLRRPVSVQTIVSLW